MTKKLLKYRLGFELFPPCISCRIDKKVFYSPNFGKILTFQIP